MKFNWKKIGIVSCAIIGLVVTFKLMPLWASITAIISCGCGFFGGMFWDDKQKNDIE